MSSESDAVGFRPLDRFALADAAALQVICKFDNQNAVLADQAHQCHRADVGMMFDEAPPTPRLTKISAPAIDIGTETRMMHGSRKLSNKAARQRKTMTMANPNVSTNPLDTWMDCRDKPLQSTV